MIWYYVIFNYYIWLDVIACFFDIMICLLMAMRTSPSSWRYDVLFDITWYQRTCIYTRSLVVLTILFDVMTFYLQLWQTFLCHDMLLDVMKYFSTSLHTFCTCWHHDILFEVNMMHFLTLTYIDILLDVMAYCLTSWHTLGFFWSYDVLFDVMIHFWYHDKLSTLFYVLLMSCIFWHYEVLFDDMLYLLTSWHAFLTSWRTFYPDFLYFLTSWHTF